MKKRFISALFAFILIAALPFNAFAAEPTEKTNSIYFEDGSYITIILEEITTRASGTKTAKKICNYTASDGTLCWEAVLTGSFTYTGTTATCTASDCDVTVYESAYYVVSNTPTKNGSTASVALTMGRKFLGITIEKKNYNWSITCDKNGNLS